MSRLLYQGLQSNMTGILDTFRDHKIPKKQNFENYIMHYSSHILVTAYK